MSDELRVLDELERRLIARLYDGAPTPATGSPRRSRWRQLRLAGAVAPGVIAAMVVVAVLLVTGPSARPSAAQALDRAATAASAGDLPVLGPGQYWYTRTINSTIAPYPLLSRSFVPVSGKLPPTVQVVSRQSEETWIGVDGTIRRRQVTLSVSFPNAAARRRWRQSGASYPSFGANDSITEGGGRFPPEGGAVGGDVGDGLFDYRQLRALPTAPASLRATLTRAQAAFLRREQRGYRQISTTPGTGVETITLHSSGSTVADARSSQLLMTIASLLTSPVTPAVRAALYRVAATLPGTVYKGPARDALGRSGVEVQLGQGTGGWRMIFDPTTGDLLQTSLTFARGGFGGLTDTVAAQGVASSIYSVPAGVGPSPGRLPAPRTVAITPRTGAATTTFSMQLQASRNAAQRTTAPAQFVTINGPTGRSCHTYLLPPPMAQLQHGKIVRTTRGEYAYRYRLGPKAIDRRTWCRGRYDLQLGAQDQTAAYFTVR